MSGSSFDEDTAIAFVAWTLAALCVVMAVRAFVRGGIGAGVAWAAGGAAFAFVAFFFATFTIRLF